MMTKKKIDKGAANQVQENSGGNDHAEQASRRKKAIFIELDESNYGEVARTVRDSWGEKSKTGHRAYYPHGR